jgi:hypothetical protein
MENVCILYAIGNILWPLFYILLAFGIVYGYMGASKKRSAHPGHQGGEADRIIGKRS